MPTNADNYWMFYLMGRDERVLAHADLDLGPIAWDLVKTPDAKALRDRAAALAAAHGKRDLEPPSRKGRSRRDKWLRENEDVLKETGAEPEQAYAAWCQARVDELAASLEVELLQLVDEAVVGERDEDPEDDEDGDESEDDDSGED